MTSPAAPAVWLRRVLAVVAPPSHPERSTIAELHAVRASRAVTHRRIDRLVRVLDDYRQADAVIRAQQ